MMGKLLPQRFTIATGLAHGSATLIARQVLANDEANEPTRIRKTRVVLVDRTVDEVSMMSASHDVLRRLDFIARVARDRCVPFGDMQVVFARDFFSISSCPQRRRWLMVLLSFSFVTCHNPSRVILSTIYRQEDAAFPAFLCGLRVGMMLTRRSCMGIRGRLRLAPALAQATFTARMFICLHCDHTCLQKSLSLHQGWSFCIGCRSRRHDWHRFVHSTSYSRTGARACMVLLHVRRAKQAKTAFLHGSTVWQVAERRGSNPQPFAPSSCATCKKAQGSIAAQALELPKENQTRIRTPCTRLTVRLVFPVWLFFFKFKFELRGKTVSKKNTNGKIPVSNSRAGYPKIAQPVTCETRKCSTASDGELLWIEAGRFLTSFFSWSTRIWSSEKILKIGRGPNFSLHARKAPPLTVLACTWQNTLVVTGHFEVWNPLYMRYKKSCRFKKDL